MRIVLATALLWLMSAVPALPHGEAEWINRGGYRNAAGELCCGERDCAKLEDDDVTRTSAGDFYIRSLTEIIPEREAQPSPDGRYWRCQWGGERKCFFAPP